MLLLHNSKSNRQIAQLLGEASKSLKTIGSPGLQIQYMMLNGQSTIIKTNTKCNFEKRPTGLLLHTWVGRQKAFIVIPFSAIEQVVLIKGKEKCSPSRFSILRLLLNLGVPLRYARYFRTQISEYAIAPMNLKIEGRNLQINFQADGYYFEDMQQYFQSLPIQDQIEIIS
ncbi:hypothetical protein [Persicobacter diffluens]|uniref:Uncharacterized protein n=1 Tax=Persicobacter diffluens TaxID=981 RepID=A0AAN4W291_9BACT|nr:hypothetical protein PEDI_39130 [Persicobacter diffluens]